MASRSCCTVARLYFGIELCSILCNSVDRMLNADLPALSSLFLFCCTYSYFCLIYCNLFNLFNLEMKWPDAKTLQLIELYEKRHYFCDKVAGCNWTVAAHATLSRDFVAHSHDKIAWENCRCDISLREKWEWPCTHSERAFSVSGPLSWNNLPDKLHSTT